MRAIGKSTTDSAHLPTNSHTLPDIKGGTGPREALFLNPDVPTPKPAEGQALVKVKAFGINRMDILQRHGKYPLPPQAPDTLGVEFSGTIDSFGPGAEGNHGFRAGDEVFGLAYGGAYAEYIAVSTGMLIRKPQSMSWEVAASIPEVRRRPAFCNPLSTTPSGHTRLLKTRN